ncbi:uncharacterized protein LOC122500364 [Leptopilina heterotoma]|uniref:uncharacterized protein LOC122500364 n=1 Tax=Leptopilina heterotoma TaxID=63436 RepID=UPI001CA8D8E9|nr:uncharacterized protein LOC122500364 [Leptopilina heterotoma]
MPIAKEILLRENGAEVSIDIVFGHERCQQKRFAVKAYLIEFHVELCINVGLYERYIRYISCSLHLLLQPRMLMEMRKRESIFLVTSREGLLFIGKGFAFHETTIKAGGMRFWPGTRWIIIAS